MTSSSEKIYQTAQKYIGLDASPADLAPDGLACAESTCDVLRDAGVDMPVFVSTEELDNFLHQSPEWLTLPGSASAEPGDVCIAPTGLGNNPLIPHGHVGIVLENSLIASNYSGNGNFLTKWSISSFLAYYKDKGGYPVYFFRYRGLTSPETAPGEEEKLQVASQAVEVATQAAKYPSLRSFLPGFLTSVLDYITGK